MNPAGLPNGYRYPALASPLDVGPRTAAGWPPRRRRSS
jgi:hypothetical protein